MDILTIGEVLIDLTQTGKDARGIPQFAANPGGAPANLAVDGFVLRRMWSENIFWTLLTATLIGAAVLYGIVLLYAFPLLARFENTTFGILKTAFLVGVRYLFCTLMMAAIYGIMGYVIVFVFTPAFLLGMGLCAMLCSFLMLRILYLIGGDPDAAHEEYDHDKN